MLVDTAGYAPGGWELERGVGYLVSDYPTTAVILRTGVPRLIGLSQTDVDRSEAFVLRRLGMRTVLILALGSPPTPWGLVEIYDSRDRRFSEDDIAVAQLLAGHLAALLHQHAHAAQVQRVYRETLASLSNALEAKDDYTGTHAQEVCDLALAVGRRLELGEADLRTVELGALLHDIGKIQVPEGILNKRAPLDEQEWQIMRLHPEAGEQILAPIASLAAVLPLVRSSHERWDGTGYPDALAGEAIALGARIVAVCDAYRAMVEPRPYRGPLGHEAALAELRTHAGTQFDPRCVEALEAALAARDIEPQLTLRRPDAG
jgi:HD-GYP domain-containing protein (c-di-GMP phosphodiesterase class II)